MDGWCSDTTWTEFASTAPCTVRPEWIKAFGDRYLTPASLFHSCLSIEHTGHSATMALVRFLLARDCPLYHEEAKELVAVLLFGTTQPNPLLWEGDLEVGVPAWTRTRDDVRLEAISHDLTTTSQEVAQLRQRLGRLKNRTASLEQKRNEAALLAVQPRLSITIIDKELMTNGLHTRVDYLWSQVYARNGRALIECSGKEYYIERCTWNGGWTYLARILRD